MRLRISHAITARFEPAVSSAIRTLRMTPRTYDGQYVVDWRIDVDHDCRLSRAFDSYGNVTHDFFLQGPLNDLAITAEGEVETDDTNGILQIGERLPTGLFLRETDPTTPDAAIRALAADLARGAGANPLDRCHALMTRLAERIDLKPLDAGALTGASTETAAAVMKAEAGTAAGIAHVFVTTARALGIPSRVVSGYVAPEDDEPAADAAAVWAECHIAGLGWVGFDAPRDRCPTERYIRVAAGLDQHGAAFLRGAHHGATTMTMTSGATVTHATL